MGPILKNAAAGAAAGAVGTFCIDQAFRLLSKARPSSGEQREPATEKMARKLMEPFGIHLEGDAKRRGGQIVHWTYGTLWGAIYGMTRGRISSGARLYGLAFGLGLFAIGDEVAVPLLRLAPGPLDVPLADHLKGLLAHLVYGAAVEGTLRALSPRLT